MTNEAETASGTPTGRVAGWFRRDPWRWWATLLLISGAWVAQPRLAGTPVPHIALVVGACVIAARCSDRWAAVGLMAVLVAASFVTPAAFVAMVAAGMLIGRRDVLRNSSRNPLEDFGV